MGDKDDLLPRQAVDAKDSAQRDSRKMCLSALMIMSLLHMSVDQSSDMQPQTQSRPRTELIHWVAFGSGRRPWNWGIPRLRINCFSYQRISNFPVLIHEPTTVTLAWETYITILLQTVYKVPFVSNFCQTGGKPIPPLVGSEYLERLPKGTTKIWWNRD